MAIDALSPHAAPSLASALAPAGQAADGEDAAVPFAEAIPFQGQSGASEEEAEAARLRAKREEQMSFLRLYIETYGAPEEKERIQEEEPESNDEEDEKKRVARASKRSQVIEDPEEPGGMKVVVWQKGRDGTYHVSRVHEFDDGRGEGRDEEKKRKTAGGSDEQPGSRVSRTV